MITLLEQFNFSTLITVEKRPAGYFTLKIQFTEKEKHKELAVIGAIKSALSFRSDHPLLHIIDKIVISGKFKKQEGLLWRCHSFRSMA